VVWVAPEVVLEALVEGALDLVLEPVEPVLLAEDPEEEVVPAAVVEGEVEVVVEVVVGALLCEEEALDVLVPEVVPEELPLEVEEPFKQLLSVLFRIVTRLEKLRTPLASRIWRVVLVPPLRLTSQVNVEPLTLLAIISRGGAVV